MVKVRKKTSRRQGTRLRERIKHKVSESQKKAKKQAKKDPTWRSKKSKDPGVPSLFPFKEQILEEVKQVRLQREAERKAKKEKARAANGSIEQLVASVGAREEDVDMREPTETSNGDPPALASGLRTHARSLRSVLSRADVIIQVLDARDPQGTRSKAMERDFLALPGDKRLVFVLNKIDLVPRENVEAWLAHLRRSFPTLPFKSSTQSQRHNLGSSAAAANHSVSASTPTQPLISLLKNYARSSAGGKAAITIGVVGMPNVGKSSLINSLKRSRACGVAPTPGFTKEIQEVALDAGLKILDCPGVVLEGGDSGPESALRNALRVEQLDDPVSTVEVLIKRCKPSQLMLIYDIPTFQSTQDFLVCVARVRGRLKKGGLPDLHGTAVSVLRDWNAGRIPYYTDPPAPVSQASSAQASLSQPSQSDAIVSSFAPSFDLEALFGESDAALTESTSAVKGAVKMQLDEPVESAGGKARLAGEVASSEGVPSEEDEDSFVADLVGSIRPSDQKKQVRFVEPPTTKRKATDEDLEAPPMPLAKKAKLQAKKAKKDARRVEMAQANGMAVDEQPVADMSAVPSPPASSLGGLDIQTGQLTVEDDDDQEEDTPYDFSAYFKRGAPQAEDDDEEEWSSEEEEEL